MVTFSGALQAALVSTADGWHRHNLLRYNPTSAVAAGSTLTLSGGPGVPASAGSVVTWNNASGDLKAADGTPIAPFAGFPIT